MALFQLLFLVKHVLKPLGKRSGSVLMVRGDQRALLGLERAAP
jgi:hypothetical protein